MPSSAHEVLLVALREQPALLGTLVAALTGNSLPRGLRPVDAAVRFTKPAEVRLDLLFQQQRRDWVIVELQRGIDPAKRRRWPLAAGVLFDQTGVLGDVIVITARRDVARWALTVAHTETPLGTKLALTPVVFHLGAHVEALLDKRRPELALFAAWAMHQRRGPKARAVVIRAIDLTRKLPRPLQQAQLRAIFSVLSEQMIALLKKGSMNPDKIPETSAGRKLRLFFEEQGRKHGLAEGKAKGLAEGEAKGLAEGRQEALLTILEAREIEISARDRAVIRRCTDTAMLDRWITRGVTATSVAEVLGAKKPAGRPRRARPSRPRASP